MDEQIDKRTNEQIYKSSDKTNKQKQGIRHAKEQKANKQTNERTKMIFAVGIHARSFCDFHLGAFWVFSDIPYRHHHHLLSDFHAL